MTPPTNGNGNSRYLLLFAAAGLMLTIGNVLWTWSQNTGATGTQIATSAADVKNLTAQYGLLVERMQGFRNDQTTHGVDIKGLQRDTSNAVSDLHGISERLADLTAKVARIESSVGIVEAQLCAESQVRNMMHSKEETQIATLWMLTQKMTSNGGNDTYPLTGCFQSEGK